MKTKLKAMKYAGNKLAKRKGKLFKELGLVLDLGFQGGSSIQVIDARKKKEAVKK